MDLGKRDSQLRQIESEIRNKKKLLIDKKKEMDKNKGMNRFLKEVKADYTKYYDFVLKEKQEQHKALLLLNEYMEDLAKTEKVVNKQSRMIKHDQKLILGEIDKVKQELNELIK